jgi:hypothetical protein
MKQILRFLFLSIMATCLQQCHSSKKLSDTFKAKLVGSICGHHIVEVADSKFYNLGTTWKNSDGKSYEHVFTVNNHCDFVKAQLKDGDMFTCEIVDKATEENCITCEAYMETPGLKRNVRVVK